MIVCPVDEERIAVVAQTDHSRVAGTLAAHWGNEDFARLQPYTSMVLAAAEHDSGWWDWEIKPSLGADGRPMDYIGSTKRLSAIWIDFYRNAVARVAEHDIYAAFNISAHGEGLATKGMGLLPKMPALTDDPVFASYVAAQREWRAEVLDSMREDPELAPYCSDEQIALNYHYMQVFDQFSQFVANRHPFNNTVRQNGPSPTLSDLPVPTKPGAETTTLHVDVVDETTAIVDPYPFDVDPLEINISARLMENRSFDTEEEFLVAYYSAPTIPIKRVLRSR